MANEKSDRDRIDAGDWVHCYLCESVFKRKRETLRYCKHCSRGFCEGEHGTFEGGRFAVCIRCYSGL